MVKLLFKYIISFLFTSLLIIVSLDYIILPNYVGYNNEHYLPDVRGDYTEKATYLLHKLGFNTNLIIAPYSEEFISGTVIKMFPRAFTKVKEGRRINLTIAGKDEDIAIPDLKLMSLRNAKLTSAKLGLSIDTIIYEYDNNIQQGSITFHIPKKGSIVKSSTKIILGVSKGIAPDYYIVPDVVNLSINKAKLTIISKGLRVGIITYEYQPKLLPNTVIDQHMTPGMRVSFPASINLTISTLEDIKWE